MTSEELALYLHALNPREMMNNVNLVADIARRIRLKQGVGSKDDELALYRVILDLKSMTELVEAFKAELDKHARDV